ncbi:hypothetical protein KIW84_070241 [Lathyrus oleraceus]|uniref:Neprosin PEP catalytic domain-containing protein n=1 Tax=Pisum sativum TaxID=3888 RepID=A0A9D4ZRY0_PEA|nr:hypothetical protein KIW84_070241 [Pisum sativum]
MIFHGASAGIGAYNLPLQANQFSISSIWLESGPPMELNSIKVGFGDRTTGHWWLIIQTTKSIYVGYWPKELFTHLSKGASLIRVGGQTYAPPNKDSPPMGSGRLPREKFINSGFMELLKTIDLEYNEIDIKPKDMKRYTDTNSGCYDLWYCGYEGNQYRQAFLYGGPGGRNCDI